MPPVSAATVAIPVEEPTESVRHFLKPEDWLAGLAMGLLSGLAFFYYMAPEVTLQDSGELVPALLRSACLIRPATRCGLYSGTCGAT